MFVNNCVIYFILWDFKQVKFLLNNSYLYIFPCNHASNKTAYCNVFYLNKESANNDTIDFFLGYTLYFTSDSSAFIICVVICFQISWIDLKIQINKYFCSMKRKNILWAIINEDFICIVAVVKVKFHKVILAYF